MKMMKMMVNMMICGHGNDHEGDDDADDDDDDDDDGDDDDDDDDDDHGIGLCSDIRSASSATRCD